MTPLAAGRLIWDTHLLRQRSRTHPSNAFRNAEARTVHLTGGQAAGRVPSVTPGAENTEVLRLDLGISRPNYALHPCDDVKIVFSRP